MTDIENAIARLTRAMGTAPDEVIGELVAERKALRAELEERRRPAAAGNVVQMHGRRL